MVQKESRPTNRLLAIRSRGYPSVYGNRRYCLYKINTSNMFGMSMKYVIVKIFKWLCYSPHFYVSFLRINSCITQETEITSHPTSAKTSSGPEPSQTIVRRCTLPKLAKTWLTFLQLRRAWGMQELLSPILPIIPIMMKAYLDLFLCPSLIVLTAAIQSTNFYTHFSFQLCFTQKIQNKSSKMIF